MSLEMMETGRLHMEQLKMVLQDQLTLPSLQIRLDAAEKNGETPFHDFTDPEMIKWFLYERRHLNEENERSRRTVREYERELLLFIEQLLTYSVAIDIDVAYIIEGSLFKSLQSRHLRRYQEWLATDSPYVLRKGAYSAATLERKTTIIKAFFTFLHEKGYIQEPIQKGLRIASVRKDDRPNRDLGPLDVITLLNTFRDLQHPVMFTIVHVLTTTGIRNEEFCVLQVKDLKVDAILGGYYLEILGKGNKLRHVPLKEKVVRSIRMFRHARGLLPIEQALQEDPLFTTNTGQAYSPSYLSQYVKKQIATTEQVMLSDKTLKITPHVFRHAFAIISKLNGVDIYDIMRSLGHEKIETTMIYLEKVFEKERHAIHSWKPEVFGDYI
ncbi:MULTISPECIES: tyrosine-type recombinase/integrase [unclassified Sporosarcina]|uniref:tyrosine-type recombinase/integrase n=1 Tax=unclassified Sporosarcina TaxID=2647733 RepID=UPI001A93A0F2|nr:MULTISPECIES: tyrosine-type recombinase/integrase [unclassified Sporosarcina]MBO0587608.1 tyrosine-type recombinase/integrase [Sporosarcina sp. E16_8]MBO0602402.1 tyrosine-type recombinase/integrase [Sporosarcina sp. E16_3]